MSIENEKITGSQLMFLIACFIQGSIVLVAFMDTLAGHDSWLVFLSAFILGLPFIFIYIFLAKKFPGKDFTQINDIIYGAYFGKLISALYIGFALFLFFVNLRMMVDFETGFIFQETPPIVLLIMFTLTCAYCVRKGIEVTSRISSIIATIIVFIPIITFVLLLKDMKFSNFLPVFDIPVKTYIHGVHIIASMPACDIVIFLMLTPFVNNMKKAGKYILLGYIIGGLTLFVVTVRNTAVLGPSASLAIDASYQAIRLIDIGNFLTRMEVLAAIGITLALFMKICILYYVSVSGISQLLRLKSYFPLIIPIGGIGSIMAIAIFESSIDIFDYASKYHLVFASFFEFVLPLLSLMILGIRKVLKHKWGKC